jgi:hypothetical protein
VSLGLVCSKFLSHFLLISKLGRGVSELVVDSCVAHSFHTPFGTTKVRLPPPCAIEWLVLLSFLFQVYLILIIAYTLGEKPPKS